MYGKVKNKSFIYVMRLRIFQLKIIFFVNTKKLKISETVEQ